MVSVMDYAKLVSEYYARYTCIAIMEENLRTNPCGEIGFDGMGIIYRVAVFITHDGHLERPGVSAEVVAVVEFDPMQLHAHRVESIRGIICQIDIDNVALMAHGIPIRATNNRYMAARCIEKLRALSDEVNGRGGI